jgi:hypothetical protein
MASTSAKRCKKYGKGHGSGTHHSRRDRVADPTKATDAQRKRAARRAKTTHTAPKPATRKAIKAAQPEQKPTPTWVIGSSANRTTPTTVAEARPPMERTAPVAIVATASPVIEERPDDVTDSALADAVGYVGAAVEDMDGAIALIAAGLDAMAKLRELPIEELNLTIRTYNLLKRENIDSVGDLAGRTEAELRQIRNFGDKSADEVKEKLAALNPPLALQSATPVAA